MNTAPAEIANLVPLPSPKPKASFRVQRFKVDVFTNPRTGSQSWRVTGSKRDGTRCRENFVDMEAARCRQIELETEYLRGQTDTTIRATKLTAEQVQVCEVAMIKLGDDWQRLLDVVDYWREHGRPAVNKDCPRLDDAVAEFLKDVEASGRRFDTKRGLKTRVPLFANAVGNSKLDAITVETVEKFLDDRKVSDRTKINDRSAVSTFFKFCMARPRQWIRQNPVRDSVVTEPEDKPIMILTVDKCAALLHEAQRYKSGKMLPYVVGGLIAGLRPYEIQRTTWDHLNLGDCEITIEPSMTKTNKKRVIKFGDEEDGQEPFNAMLKKWIKLCKGKPFFPPNSENDLQTIKRKVGVPVVVDILRHTAVSHFFRLTGSYGRAAEVFGNSEAKIKKHYDGKASTADMKKFYAIAPKGKASR